MMKMIHVCKACMWQTDHGSDSDAHQAVYDAGVKRMQAKRVTIEDSFQEGPYFSWNGCDICDCEGAGYVYDAWIEV